MEQVYKTTTHLHKNNIPEGLSAPQPLELLPDDPQSSFTAYSQLDRWATQLYGRTWSTDKRIPADHFETWKHLTQTFIPRRKWQFIKKINIGNISTQRATNLQYWTLIISNATQN